MVDIRAAIGGAPRRRSGRSATNSMTRPRTPPVDDAEGDRQHERDLVQGDQRVGHHRPEHEDLGVGQVQHVEQAEHQGVAQPEQGVDGPEEHAVQQLLDRVAHVRPRQWAAGRRMGAVAGAGQLGLTEVTRVKPPWPSMEMTQIVWWTSWVGGELEWPERGLDVGRRQGR